MLSSFGPGVPRSRYHSLNFYVALRTYVGDARNGARGIFWEMPPNQKYQVFYGCVIMPHLLTSGERESVNG
jgi:hypothetical protein